MALFFKNIEITSVSHHFNSIEIIITVDLFGKLIEQALFQNLDTSDADDCQHHTIVVIIGITSRYDFLSEQITIGV